MTTYKTIVSTLFWCLLLFSCSMGFGQAHLKQEIIAVLTPQVIKQAQWALNQEPITVTHFFCQRSAGSKHDFYSEGDYWWPDPQHPDGPYIQRDGQTNPENFVEHRKAMIRLSTIIGTLASAYYITKQDQYVQHALRHLTAWFVDTTTRMNPSLLYAQAIKGRVTGRGIGIIDTIHLMEVVQGIRVMEKSAALDQKVLASIKSWFEQYLHWLTTHPYGIDEMKAENNHGTCWVMQVACFSTLTGNKALMRFCRKRYKSLLLPNQMAADGSFPRELSRTKPYGYSLFNLDAMAMICQILSDKKPNLWKYKTKEGQSIQKGIEFLSPYIKSKQQWPFAKDVMYWNEWPVAHPFLAFGGLAFTNIEWINLWKGLEHHPSGEEVVRNLPIRNPIIWLK